MKIYHGSIEKVENPEIRESNRTLDYGRGFYTTTSYEQAESWVRRRMGEKKVALESEPPDIMDNMPRKSPVPPIKVSRVLALSPGMGI